METFKEPSNSTKLVKDLIDHIQQCNDDISSLSLAKQHSEHKLKDMLCHTKHGSHTHEFLDYKITITTGSNFTLDKNAFYEYLTGHEKIDSKFDIVKQITKYDINPKAIKNLDMFGTNRDIALKDTFIKQNEKKLHVKIIKNEFRKYVFCFL